MLSNGKEISKIALVVSRDFLCVHPMSSLQSATFVTKLTRLGGGLKLQFPALIYDFNVSASLSEMS